MDRLTAQGQAFATAQRAMYSDSCTIRRVVTTKGADLGNLSTSQVVVSNVPLRIKESSASEMQIAGMTQGIVGYTVRMPAWNGNTPINLTSNDFLDIAARGEVEAYTLSVVAPLPSSGVMLEAVAERQA